MEAQAPQLLRVPLPVFGDLDAQVQVNPGPEERLDLAPGPAADVLEPGALGPDDDGLLARPFHVHDGVHIGEPAAVRARSHVLDQHGDRMRQLVPDPLERGLPDQLGDELLLGRRPSGARGWRGPGVSTRMCCASGRCTMPRTPRLVVCGRLLVIATLVPTSALSRVDFPTLGRPAKQAKPERYAVVTAAGCPYRLA